jgi:hypothetical protein
MNTVRISLHCLLPTAYQRPGINRESSEYESLLSLPTAYCPRVYYTDASTPLENLPQIDIGATPSGRATPIRISQQGLEIGSHNHV